MDKVIVTGYWEDVDLYVVVKYLVKMLFVIIW